MLPVSPVLCPLLMVISLVLASACTSLKSDLDGFPVYKDIRHSRQISFQVGPEAPSWIQGAASVAIRHWNRQLGFKAFRLTNRSGDVQIRYRESARLETHPGETHLKGCMEPWAGEFECTIFLQIPVRLSTVEDLARANALLRASPIDKDLAQSTHDSAGTWLRDKLAVFVLIHEIGHSAGLAHTELEGCMMHSTPRQDFTFCEQELAAIRNLLTPEIEMARRNH